MKHISPLQKNVFLPLTCRILKRNHIFSPSLSWLTKGTRSYKTSLEKHKDDQGGTRSLYKCMNVMKKNAMDDKIIERCKTCENNACKWFSINQEAVEDVLARQKVYWWIEKLLRSYRDKVQKSQWIEIMLTSVETRRKRGSIEVNLLRIYREAVELEEKRFFKEEKHIKINATNKLLKQGSNRHVKLSKLSLNKKNAKHSWSKTHTH